MNSADKERRQLLLQRALAKIKQMKKGSAFITDWSACEIMQELVQEILTIEQENKNLIKKLNKKT